MTSEPKVQVEEIQQLVASMDAASVSVEHGAAALAAVGRALVKGSMAQDPSGAVHNAQSALVESVRILRQLSLSDQNQAVWKATRLLSIRHHSADGRE